MDIQVKCSGAEEKAIIEHRKKHYPHLVKSSWSTYFRQLAKDARERDRRSNEVKES